MQTLQRHPASSSVVVDGEAVVLDGRGGVHLLSSTGTVVWESLDGTVTTAGLIAELSDAYGIGPDVIGPDVRKLLDDFQTKGLLAGPSAAGPGAEAGPHDLLDHSPHVMPEPPST